MHFFLLSPYSPLRVMTNPRADTPRMKRLDSDLSVASSLPGTPLEMPYIETTIITKTRPRETSRSNALSPLVPLETTVSAVQCALTQPQAEEGLLMVLYRQHFFRILARRQ